VRTHPGYRNFPPGFFDRGDELDDAHFYEPVRLVTHIDDAAIASVGALYERLGISGRVLDLMSSWVSHFTAAPAELVVLGMNWTELHSNPDATEAVAHDLNRDPRLPFADNSFDDVVCAVSVDYLVQPLEVFTEVARVLRPHGRFVCTFSNRCFPTKAIRGWLLSGERQRCELVAMYFDLSDRYGPAIIEERTDTGGDPLYAVWAEVR
jgi:SAM-dependent methyltransferase